MLVADAVDLLHLAGAEALGRIEAPDSFQQPLPPQNFVTAGDAAVKIVGDVEKRAVAVGDAGIESEQIGGDAVLVARGAAHLELLDGVRGPHRPMAEQTAAEIGTRGDALVAQVERQREVEQDMVVIAGIERDAVERTGGGDTAQHVEGAVTIERRDLDGDDVVDSRETPPEIRAEDDAADGRLQIKANQRNLARHRLAMGDDLVFGYGFHRGETEQARVIADAARDLGFRNGLPCRAGEPGDQRQRALGPGRRGLRGQFQHRPVQPDVADGELRGVNADREAPGAGVDIIACQRALMDSVERAAGVERQRVRRNHRAIGDQTPHLGFHRAMVHRAYPYPYSGPATANGSFASWAAAWPNRIR